MFDMLMWYGYGKTIHEIYKCVGFFMFMAMVHKDIRYIIAVEELLYCYNLINKMQASSRAMFPRLDIGDE